MKSAISRAFYANNRDVTSADVLADIAAEEGDDRDAFAADFLNPEVRNETFRDFLFAQQSGVHGFPCLLVGNEASSYTLSSPTASDPSTACPRRSKSGSMRRKTPPRRGPAVKATAAVGSAQRLDIPVKKNRPSPTVKIRQP